MKQTQYKGEMKRIDTEEKAYLLGLIMADGGLFYNKASGAYQTKIKLKISDLELLTKIQDKFTFFTEPKIERRKDGNHSYHIYRYSKQLFLDLNYNGILERKSYENANSVFMPIFRSKPKLLFFNYLRGLFDGDGSVNQDLKGRIRVDLVGKNRDLFSSIVLKLHFYGIKADLRYRQDRDYWMIRISSKSNVRLFIFNIDTGCQLFLERKFKPYFNIDWSRIPGHDNINKEYNTLLVK